MIKPDKRDWKRLQLYFTAIKDEIIPPPKTEQDVWTTRNREIKKGKIPEMPEWMKIGQKVEVKAYHKREKNKIMTIRTIEWPFLVTFEEMPIGGTNPRRILGPIFENESEKP